MKSRPIINPEETEEILRRCEVGVLSMVDSMGQPYSIPMNFGYKEGVVYFHSSAKGKKIDLLQKNPQVCIVFSTDHELRWQSEKVACSYSMKYRSVLVFGEVEFIREMSEKVAALNCIMAQYTDREFTYNEPAVKDVCVFKVKCRKMEGRVYGF